MKLDQKRPGSGKLLFVPWIFKGQEKGMSMKEGDEYWILGAQFL